MQGMTTHFKTSKALKVSESSSKSVFLARRGPADAVLNPLLVSCRSRRRWVRMPHRSAMTSWWPCQCGSSTSTCAGWPRMTLCGWSSGEGPWKTGATPPAAESSASPRRRSWRGKRQNCSRRWTNWPVKMPAWDWSWMPCEPSMRPFNVLPGLLPVGPTRRARWPPPVSSPLSSPPTTTTPTRPHSQLPPSVDRTGPSFFCLVLPGFDPAWTHFSCTDRMLSTYTEGWNRVASSMWCFHNSVSLLLSLTQSTLSVHCAKPSLNPSTGRVLAFYDPVSLTDRRDLQVFDMP